MVLNAGHVRIFENIGGSWSQIGQDIDGESAILIQVAIQYLYLQMEILLAIGGSLGMRVMEQSSQDMFVSL
jgi:hypothetical protein